MKNTIKESLGSSLFIIAVLLAISLITLMPILNVLLLGAIIAYGIRPLSRKLQKKLKFSSVSIILSIILVVIPLILVLAYTISVIMDLSSFISSNDLFNSISLTQNIDSINTYLPTEMKSSTATITTTINESITDILKTVLEYFIEFIKSLPFVALQLFVLLFSTFYFARDGHKIKPYVTSFIPENRHRFFKHMLNEIKLVLKSIFYGHFLTAVIIGTIAAIGFSILGYPYGIFLGILTGIFQLIPVLGPWPIYLILFIWDIISGNYIRGVIVLLFGFGLSLSDMYIRPAISVQYIDIHPLIFLLGFMAGPIVFGVVGFIIGPLILGITYAVIKTYKDEKEKLLK
ncbi:putative inner membrane protein [Methanobrevibacter cuticularis]|uniref:Putative inner membrane protein n=1 Tax=Methanobrevibacter cuticularis TaxID=47311 RepID=A0A166FH14_9EURY|nr:AI-2E family transporter [Methanobrevibacter cuticularis]KZX17663.1 putative inner membrane protein [Methanobrevibacter cuticularis]